MLKFFVTDFMHEEIFFCGAVVDEDGVEYESGDSYNGPFHAEVPDTLSFSNLENARVRARKIRDVCEVEESPGERVVTYHTPHIYSVDVPNNWNGDDVAWWLMEAIKKREIQLVN